MKKKTKRQKAIIRRRIFVTVLSLFLVAVIALLAFVINAVFKTSDDPGENISSQNSSSQQNDDNSSSSKPSKKEITATVLNTGDILIHDNILWGAELSDGSYDFSKLFKEANFSF